MFLLQRRRAAMANKISTIGDFHVKFDNRDYNDIRPREFAEEYLRHDECINERDFEKGNIDKCIWTRHVPTAAEIASPEWRSIEMKRILKTGVFIAIKNIILWIPPAYYTSLAYGKVGEMDLQFRLKRLKNVYEKIRVRNNPNCFASLVIKNRADGETTMSISDAMWEMMDGNMNVGNIGIQSKTRSDSINPCWSTAQILWQSYPQWLKDELYSDFVSGENIAEKMQFMRSGNEAQGKSARNIRMQYYPCVYNAMDGKHNMKKCILDEICKWIEAEFYDTFTNYSAFIMPGFERRGIMDLFSSPSDVPTKSNEQVYSLYKDSDASHITFDPITKTYSGTTKSRVHRIHSNPLEGIQGAYDQWGDADPQKIYDWIMTNRKNAPKDKVQGLIRAYPMNESEMFDSPDASSLWDNKKGIETRKIYLMGARFKDEKTQDPIKVFGNLEWRDGIVDTDVDFRQADKTEFDVDVARFAFSFLPQNKEPLKYANVIVRGENIGEKPRPPAYVENVIGIDPFDKRYPGKNPSNGAMVNFKFRDIFETGIVKCPTMIYCNRPGHNEIFYEDCIKACVFNRAMGQPESINSKVIDFFEDRGYMDWLLSKIGHPRNSLMKGDAPTGGKNALLDEMIGLINAITNTPLSENDPYLLERNYFYELLDDISKFNKSDTHANDLSMSFGQSLLGSAKLLFKKTRAPSEVNEGVLEYLLG